MKRFKRVHDGPGTIYVASFVVSIGLITGCGGEASLPISAGFGPAPTIPAPQHALIPTINVVDAIHWSAGQQPTPASGLSVAAFATGLVHPRFIYVLPNGDVLVSETNAPTRPDDNTGIKGWFFKHFQKKAGGAVPSPNRISLLRDVNADGVADRRFDFLAGLNSPFGITLVDRR